MMTKYPNKKGMSNIEYWKQRREKSAVAGVCPSHKNQKVVPGKRRCQKCLDSSNLFIKNQKRKKQCLSHKNVLAAPGKYYCHNCLATKRLTWLRSKGVNEKEIQKAKYAIEIFDGVCRCCGTKISGTKGWALDHSHETGKFRGIVCSSCNIGLGHAKDDPKKLAAMAEYLRKNNA
ncbi:MAG: endonuclease VII domain-containing protein [Thaumarchaeota archaeon]|nr:endonuclease VII domain-containing protein [Nitrososphaerota archaeon]